MCSSSPCSEQKRCAGVWMQRGHIVSPQHLPAERAGGGGGPNDPFEGFDVRPLSAAESCWCQGSIRQPQAFQWSN